MAKIDQYRQVFFLLCSFSVSVFISLQSLFNHLLQLVLRSQQSQVFKDAFRLLKNLLFIETNSCAWWWWLLNQRGKKEGRNLTSVQAAELVSGASHTSQTLASTSCPSLVRHVSVSLATRRPVRHWETLRVFLGSAFFSSCNLFLYLHVFSEVAACRTLLAAADVREGAEREMEKKNSSIKKSTVCSALWGCKCCTVAAQNLNVLLNKPEPKV